MSDALIIVTLIKWLVCQRYIVATMSSTTARDLTRTNDGAIFHHRQTSLADVTETIRAIYNRTISPATNRTTCYVSTENCQFVLKLVYLRSTFAYSEGQTWLCIAALTTNVERLTESSKFCFKYLNMNK